MKGGSALLRLAALAALWRTAVGLVEDDEPWKLTPGYSVMLVGFCFGDGGSYDLSFELTQVGVAQGGTAILHCRWLSLAVSP